MLDAPFSLQEIISSEIERGEKVLWAGQPDPARFARKSLPIVIFGIPWTAFALFWVAGAAGFKIPDFNKGWDLFPLFGVPFVLIGLGMLSAPQWLKRKARNTAYVVTDKRAVIFEGGRNTAIRSFGPEALEDLKRTQRADGSGDIAFCARNPFQNQDTRGVMDVGFFGIAEVKHVEDLLRDIVEKHETETRREEAQE